MELHQFFTQWPPRHHAYTVSSMHTSIEDIKREVMQNEVSYVYDRYYDTFSIDDARMIKQLQSEKTDTASVFIISFSVINTEAQNALLKVLEEPAPNTYFFILYPNVKQLLPTLQSRLEVLNFNTTTESTSVISAKEFIGLSLIDRFNWIKDHTDTKAGEEKLSKEQVKELLYELERHYAQSKELPNSEVLETIYEAQRCINANGASAKMILDMVAVYV